MAGAAKVIVTGGLGFIGATLVERLYANGTAAVVVDSLNPTVYPTYRRKKKAEAFRAMGLPVSISDAISIEDELRSFDLSDVDVIVNASALPGQRYSWSNQKEYYRNNLEAPLSLARFASARGLRFIHLSTSSVYGQMAVGSESADVSPISPYGHSKYAAEVALAHHLDPDKLAILRLFSVYGPGQRDDMAIHRLLVSGIEGRTFTVFGDGLQSRTPTFVGDVVDALCAVNDKRLSGTYNVGGAEPHSLKEIIAIVEAVTHTKLKIIRSDSEIGDQRDTRADYSKLAASTGWGPRTSLEDGISSQLKSLLLDYQDKS